MIRNKIIYGYALVLGIALTGSVSGLMVGNYYQQKALHDRQNAAKKLKFLSNLQLRILYNRPAKQLSPYIGDAQGFRRESAKFLQQIQQIQKLLATQHTSQQGSNVTDLQSLLDQYEVKVAIFLEQAKNVVQQVDKLTTSPADKEKARKLIVQLVQSPEFITFIELPDQIQGFYNLAEKQEQAAEVALSKAETLRTKIIVTGLMLSIIIAIVLTIYTSNAIAAPIQTVTNIAQQVTKESNFDLQAPITSNDEVGILANTMNQLIQQVKQLLQKLNQKNVDLQQALKTLNQQQSELIQYEKMSSLGQLVAGVAHEINNPVNFIHGNLLHMENCTQDLLNFIQLFQKYYPHPVPEIEREAEEIDLEFLQEDFPKMLASMKVGTERIRQIVLSLRNFSRLDEAELKLVDIHEGIDSTLMILQHRLKAQGERPQIKVSKDYSHLPLVECYVGQLNQVFMNILANAIDALEVSHQNQIMIRTELVDEDWVKIAIADNGSGISETIQQRIFDPFFTTKPIGKGTGMGMSISYQIITERHGGKLELFSTVGKGTEFVIQIPIRQEIRKVV
ncbi:sensor histidine kinase [Anabaena catenula]|uniref:histidine kinase n=1 Tax=Anabaena catenula FACHB-362 TaxID=2692877 RepID=A0ABR8IZV0_9NOST|nr:ATP-binding protein [Anabaena catenula]MBD2690845.1 HAMP domain-containing histidine kinase [Anabaena catenula FACHB-362]